MIQTFYSNFAWRDLESIFWKKQDKDLNEFIYEEYPTYNLKECYTALNTMLYNRMLILKAEKEYWTKAHWMILEYNQQ
jgi:hypothetical protein